MRQFAGFGSADDTNRRFKYLLQHGQTGLSVAFDMPTLMGIDADDPRAHGEVGHCGVAVSSLDDMERLFEDIPLDQVTTSMTINGPAAVIFAMYLAVAEKRGISVEHLGGTLQNDILKEYIAQKEWLFPPEPSLRLITDTIAYCAKHVPKWHPISISGYHIREAGSTAVQELAFTLYDGLTYVEEPSRPDFPWIASPRSSRSFSMSTTTSLKRSPSSGRPGGFGPGRWNADITPKIRGRRSSAVMRRRPAVRLRPSSP